MGELLTSHNKVISDGRFSYGRADFEAIRRLLYQLTGIRLADSKDSMVYSRLVRRIRALRLTGFPEYIVYLGQTPVEEELFINALTTNLTSFFREPHHFDILAQYLNANPQTKTIWCAACSTGEEAYSIAMVLAETYGSFNPPVKIIASDIDSQVLQSARAGIYDAARITSVSEQRRKQFFFRGTGSKLEKVKVVKELQTMVEFRQLNLLDKNWHIPPPVDVIFCRNVMIYFDKKTQLQLLERMVRLMPAQGLYVAGHSENFTHASHLVKAAGNTTYHPNVTGSSYGSF